MNYYTQKIIEYTGCPEKDVDEVEEMMRVEHPTLDNLDAEQFKKYAKEAWDALKWSRTPEGQAFMKGLPS